MSKFSLLILTGRDRSQKSRNKPNPNKQQWKSLFYKLFTWNLHWFLILFFFLVAVKKQLTADKTESFFMFLNLQIEGLVLTVSRYNTSKYGHQLDSHFLSSSLLTRKSSRRPKWLASCHPHENLLNLLDPGFQYGPALVIADMSWLSQQMEDISL